MRAAGLGAHSKQPEMSLKIVFPQIIRVPVKCIVCACVQNMSSFLQK